MIFSNPIEKSTPLVHHHHIHVNLARDSITVIHSIALHVIDTVT